MKSELLRGNCIPCFLGRHPQRKLHSYGSELISDRAPLHQASNKTNLVKLWSVYFSLIFTDFSLVILSQQRGNINLSLLMPNCRLTTEDSHENAGPEIVQISCHSPLKAYMPSNKGLTRNPRDHVNNTIHIMVLKRVYFQYIWPIDAGKRHAAL